MTSLSLATLSNAVKTHSSLITASDLSIEVALLDSKINVIQGNVSGLATDNSLTYWSSPTSITSITNSVLPGALIFVKNTSTTQKIMLDATESLHSNVYNTLINQITIKCIDNDTTYTLDETSNNISIDSTEKSITFSYTATKKSDHLLTLKIKKPDGATILTYTKIILSDEIFEFPTMVETTRSAPYDQTYVTVGQTLTLNTLFDVTIDSNVTATVDINDQYNTRTLSTTITDKTISYDLLINYDNNHSGTLNLVLVGAIQESYSWNATNILTATNHIYSYPNITQHTGFDNDYGAKHLKLNEAGKIRLTLTGGDGLHSNVFTEQLEFVKYKVGSGGTFINRDHTYVTIDKDNNTIEITDITPTSAQDVFISVKLISINSQHAFELPLRTISTAEIVGAGFTTTMKVLYVWDNDPDIDGAINHDSPITWSRDHASNYNIGTLESWRWGHVIPEFYNGNPGGRGTNAFLDNSHPGHHAAYGWQNDSKQFEILTWTVPGTGTVYKFNRALHTPMGEEGNNWYFLKNGALATNFVRNGVFNSNTEQISLDPGYWTHTGDNLSVNHVFMFKLSDIDSVSSGTADHGPGGWWLAKTTSYLGIMKSGSAVKGGSAGWINDRDGGVTLSDWEHNHDLTTDDNKKYFFSVGLFWESPTFAVHFSMGDFPGFTVDSLILIEARLLGSYHDHHERNDYRMVPSGVEVKIYFWADNMWKSTIKKTRNNLSGTIAIDREGYTSVGGTIGFNGNPPHTWFATGYSDDNWVNEREGAINFLTKRYTNSTLTTQQLIW